VIGALDLARLAGHLVWTERRLFEVVGTWVREVDDPATKVALATQSRHHAWRAEQVAVLLSTFAGTGAAELAGAGERVLDDAVARCDGAPPRGRVGVLRDTALPALLAAYERALVDLDDVSGAPARRVLRIARDDLERDRAALEALDVV
jgi:hypothetical protein